MLREILEGRIRQLLERASVVDPPPIEVLVELLESRIDASIEAIIFDEDMRTPVRERPALGEKWPLCVSSTSASTWESTVLLHLWRVERGDPEAVPGDLLTKAHAMLLTIEDEVERDRRRAAMAIDAGRAHHALVKGTSGIPKDGQRKRGGAVTAKVEGGYIELFAPEQGIVRLLFPEVDLSETIMNTLQRWRGTKGLRHWAAMQRLLSIEGGRVGRVTWKLEEHMEALNYAADTRRDQKVRNAVEAEVTLLTKMELAVFDAKGKLRIKQPLFARIAKAERQIEESDTWVIEGMTLEIHPLLYDGVRDQETGKMGTNWYPQVVEVAKIDDVRFPHAIALGLLLPIRWRWCWGEGKDHCAMSGSKLLAAAGIEYDPRRDSRAWMTLRRSLNELVRIGALGRYQWNEMPDTLNGVCRMYPAQWAVDRTVHKLPPIEQSARNDVLVGKQLREWREGRKWTQEQLAKAIGVTRRTIINAESTPEEGLTTRLMGRLQALIRDLRVEAASKKEKPLLLLR